MIAAVLLAVFVLTVASETAHAQQRQKVEAKPGTTCSMMHTVCVGAGQKHMINEQALPQCQRSREFCMKTGVYRLRERDVYGLLKH